jgi:hypothetical protein
MYAPRQGWTTATNHGKLEPFVVWLPAEGCQTERPDRANGPGTRCVPAFDEELYQCQC